MPLFSVIIPSYNRYDRLCSAIDSVLSQSFRDFELIVVDDGSTDDTPLIQEQYSGRIRYLRQKQEGVSSARNNGIRHASSPYIALLDSDDLWLTEKLAAQAEFIRLHPEIRIHQTDEIWIRNGKRVNPRNRHRKSGGYIFPQSLHLCLISPSAVVLHRDIFDRYGYFDEGLPVCEDYDLWLRTTWREETGFIPEQHIIKHGGHGDQLSRSEWGMDRFRIYSICRLLSTTGKLLPPGYILEAQKVALGKCRILQQGAVKRGNTTLTAAAEDIINSLENGDCSPSAIESLVEIQRPGQSCSPETVPQ
ncbi:MAG TPA: glycosyltransferase [Spirochaetota bacterium]|nr:glycosyltransferase [Spirochaetota bacterium]